MKIHKGDTVQVTTGKDKGKSGKVLRVFQEKNTILLEGINVYKKHKRPKKQGEKGEIVELPRPLQISNVLLFCGNCRKGSRAGFRIEGERKIRICKSCKKSF